MCPRLRSVLAAWIVILSVGSLTVMADSPTKSPTDSGPEAIPGRAGVDAADRSDRVSDNEDPGEKGDEQQRETPRVLERLSDETGILGGAVRRVREVIESAADSAKQPSAQAPGEPQILPANLVYVRVSRRFLEDFLEREVERTAPLRDCILGTTLVGNSHSRTHTEFWLHPNQDQAVGEFTFAGRISSRTNGYNGPVILHNVSQTNFTARKKLSLDDAGVHESVPVARAVTRSTTVDIDACLPGLQGRIAERIAWRRVNEMRSEADRIAAQHAEQRIEQAINARVAEALTKARATLVAQLRGLPYDHDNFPPLLKASSTPDYMQIVMHRPEASPYEHQFQPPAMDPDADISVRVHRAVLRRAVTEPDIRRAALPLLAGLIKNRPVRQVLTSLRERNAKADDRPQQEIEFQLIWSPDWLAVDYTGPAPRLKRPGELPAGDSGRR